MPDFVSSPANFCQLLLSFVGYFDVFPNEVDASKSDVLEGLSNENVSQNFYLALGFLYILDINSCNIF